MGLVLARRFGFRLGFHGAGSRSWCTTCSSRRCSSARSPLAKIDFASHACWLHRRGAARFTLAGFAPFARSADRRSSCLDRKLLAVGIAMRLPLQHVRRPRHRRGVLASAQGVALAASLLGVMIPLANVLAVAMLASHGEARIPHELAHARRWWSPRVGGPRRGTCAGLPAAGVRRPDAEPTRGDRASRRDCSRSARRCTIERGRGPIAAHTPGGSR